MKVKFSLIRGLAAGLMLLFLHFANAQVTVKGKVVADSLHTPLEFVTVQAGAPKDTQLLKPLTTVVTNAVGDFELQLPAAGDHIISLRLIGFRSRNTVVHAINSVYDMGMLTLEREPSVLQGVVVSTGIKLIERKIDRLVFNIAASPVASGGSVWDALPHTPSVIVTGREEILVNGKTVIVYVDDRPLHLSFADVANYLRSLPAANILSIEVIYNPPASYDAEGASIINIRTNRKLVRGFTGSISAQYQQGFYARSLNSLNLNYKRDKILITANINLTAGNYRSMEEDYFNYFTAQPPVYWRLDQTRKTRTTAVSYTTNLFYDISKKSSLVIGFEGMNNDSRARNLTNAFIFGTTAAPDSSQRSLSIITNDISLYSGTVNYTLKLDSIGGSLRLNADHTIYQSGSGQTFRNISFDKDGAPMGWSALLVGTDQDIHITTAKIDFSKLLKGGVKMDAGAKLTFITTDNPFDFRDSVNSVFVRNPLRSNVFKYEERTQAAYLSFNKDFRKIKLYGGLRAENTTTEARSVTLNQTNHNDYFRLFPTVFMQYDLNQNNKFNFSYNKRISRPDYWRLNPFQRFVSANYYLTGNPFLQPALTHSFSLSHLFRGKYYASVFYNATSDRFSNITIQDYARRLTVDSQYNFPKTFSYGFDAYTPMRITDFLDFNHYLYLAHRSNESLLQNKEVRFNTWRFYDQANLVFSLSKKRGYKLEVSSLYTSKDIVGVFQFDDMFDLSLGLKLPLSQQTSLSLNLTDISYTSNYEVNVRYLDQANGFKERNETRTFSIRLTHNFGAKKKIELRSFEKTNQEESGRLRRNAN